MPDDVRAFDLRSRAVGILLRLLAPALMLAATPAFAQAWPNDVKATQFLDATYMLSPQWRLNFYGEVREDHNISRMDNSIFRPNVQYEFARNWRVGVGYIQFQSWQSPFHAERGPFEDLYYQNKVGKVGLLGRLRFNETFADNNSAVFVTSAFFASASAPILDSDWFFNLSNEIYFALKTDYYPGRKTGYAENKTFFGTGYKVSSEVTLLGGYEINMLNFTTPLTAHNFKLGLIAGF
jgi:hypothetical protein